MKLELKHLSPYLPYGLNLLRKDNNGIYRMVVSNNSVSWIDGVQINSVLNDRYEKFIPILRPLSDLTKEIEHNGERFIPIDILGKNHKEFYFDFNGSLLIKRKNTNMYIPIIDTYAFIEKLFEWHFDVFGLIDAGIAIDINTVEI